MFMLSNLEFNVEVIILLKIIIDSICPEKTESSFYCILWYSEV